MTKASECNTRFSVVYPTETWVIIMPTLSLLAGTLSEVTSNLAGWPLFGYNVYEAWELFPMAAMSNPDTRINSHGLKLLTVLENYSMLIANDRVCGDLGREYNCCQWNGMSVVDILIVQRKFYICWTISKLNILIDAAHSKVYFLTLSNHCKALTCSQNWRKLRKLAD